MNNFDVVASSDPRDAPFTMYTYPDGAVELRRDLEPPVRGEDWTKRIFLPRAVVLVDGGLSLFDAEHRQRN